MVCGSIGHGGIEEIKNVCSVLRKERFDTLDHILQEGMDYSSVKDFRGKRELARSIVAKDMEYVMKADIVVAISNGPSYGTAIELYAAKNAGKRVVVLAEGPVPTPWLVTFSDYIVTSKAELVELLRGLKEKDHGRSNK
jgi:nucleoside 2-deoxyribosyltransferase